MKGLHNSGDPILNPEDNLVTKYANPGNPYDDEGFGDGNWVETDDGMGCGDKSSLMGIGPFSLAINESQEIIFAYVVGERDNAFDSIRDLKEQVGLIQNLADNDFDFTKLEITDAVSQPNNFRLYQNYPNPFNPSTNIEFNLPQESAVTLVIYDLVGNKVRTLANGYLEAGLQSIIWDSLDDNGNPVSSGMYFYNITTGNNSQTKKMVLLR